MQNGNSNNKYDKENDPTTHPWGLIEKYFGEGNDGKNFSGSLRGLVWIILCRRSQRCKKKASSIALNVNCLA